MKIVSVKFRPSGSKVYTSQPYYYKTFFDVEVGDLVIVDTSTNGVQIAMVDDANVTDPVGQSKATKYLVQRVDREEYDKRVEHELKLTEVKLKMSMKLKEFQELAIYELAADMNPEIAELLKEYKELLAE